MIELTVGAWVVVWRGGWVDGGVVARLCAGGSFMWQCWSCSACLRLFVVVLWLVFVGGLGELLP